MEIKDLFIDGGPIYLRVPTEKDLNGNWYKWLNDPIVTRYQNKGIFPNTRAKQKEYFLSMKNSENDIIFAIVEKQTQRHIGCGGLHKIDCVHRTAEIGILIGEKEYWNKGYGKLAWSMITDYGFNRLNLHRIYATVMKENIASRKSAEASGFKVEGEMRDTFFKNGKYYSALFLAVLEGEYKKKKKV